MLKLFRARSHSCSHYLPIFLSSFCYYWMFHSHRDRHFHSITFILSFNLVNVVQFDWLSEQNLWFWGKKTLFNFIYVFFWFVYFFLSIFMCLFCQCLISNLNYYSMCSTKSVCWRAQFIFYLFFRPQTHTHEQNCLFFIYMCKTFKFSLNVWFLNYFLLSFSSFFKNVFLFNVPKSSVIITILSTTTPVKYLVCSVNFKSHNTVRIVHKITPSVV